MNGVNLVIGYIRVSSLDQLKESESLPRQEAQIRSYCVAKGWNQPMIISDEGVSGFKEKRSGYQKLLELCRQGKVETLIVYDLSRLGRSVRSTLTFVEDLIQRQNINFVSLSQDIDTQTPHGKAFLTLISVFNQLYRDEIAFKTRAAIAHKKSKQEKYTARIPFGFSETIDGKLHPLDQENAVLKRILGLKASGLSFRAIASALESEGIKTKSGNLKWQPRFIKKLIDRSVSNGR